MAAQVDTEVLVLTNDNGEYGVVDSGDNIVVPYGKYAWIDIFDKGLARVRTAGMTNFALNNIVAIMGSDGCSIITDRKQIEKQQVRCKWGVINKNGEEVIPLEYDEIWNFKGKTFPSIIAVKAGKKTELFFEDIPGSTCCPWRPLPDL